MTQEETLQQLLNKTIKPEVFNDVHIKAIKTLSKKDDMKQYTVTLRYTATIVKEIDVDATNKEEALRLAKEEAECEEGDIENIYFDDAEVIEIN